MIKESDLYHPVKLFLSDLGYSVKAEVNHCDLVATKTEDIDTLLLIVELKLSLSVDLLVQGVNRQSLSDNVYLAIPAPNTAVKKRHWRAKQSGYLKLLKQIGLGLMLVETQERKSSVKIVLDPAPYKPRKNARRQTSLLKEFNAREGDLNIGGVNKTKIMTAYRQNALKLAQLLNTHQKLSIKQLRQLSDIENISSILQKNHYGWFVRVERGVYQINNQAEQALLEYQKRQIENIAKK